MDLFKFLRKKQEYSFETLLQKAATNPAYQVEFIKRILTENLVIITKSTSETEGLFRLEKGMRINVFTLKDGRVPIFTSPNRIFDKGIITKEVNYLQANAEDIFGFLKGATLILNPYSEYGKEFNPDEVERLLNGTYFEATKIVVEKGHQVQIGQPANYPTEVVKRLIKLFSTKPDVIAAYLGWIHDPTTTDPPHYIFAINTIGEWRTISDEAGLIAQGVLGTREIIDFTQITNKGFIDDYFTKNTKPFYIKTQ